MTGKIAIMLPTRPIGLIGTKFGALCRILGQANMDTHIDNRLMGTRVATITALRAINEYPGGAEVHKRCAPAT